MNENQIARHVVDTAVKIHMRLGPGLFESVYETILAHELRMKGLDIKCQVPIAVKYDNIRFDIGFKADIIVENKVIIELKSVEKLSRVHPKQLLTYLRLSGMHLGLLLNFGAATMWEGIKRIANDMDDNLNSYP